MTDAVIKDAIGRRDREHPTGRFADHTEVSDPQCLGRNPVVSIIVATYKHERVLQECIESLAAQRVDFPFEILIAEDCSPDRTRDVALGLQRKYPDLVRVIWTPLNKGATLNTIFATSLCRGTFIGSCDGDDFWIDENKLTRQVAALEGNPGIDLAFTRGYRYLPDGTRLLGWNYGEEERVVSAKELFETQAWMAPTASLLFRANVLHSLPDWFEQSPFGDAIIVMAGSHRGGAHYDPHPTICYRTAHDASFTVGLLNAPLDEQERYYKSAIAVYERACAYYGVAPRIVAHRVDDYRLSLAKAQAGLGKRSEALRSLMRIGVPTLAGGALRRLARKLGIAPKPKRSRF